MISNFHTSYTLRRALALRFSRLFSGEHMRLHWKVELKFQSFQPSYIGKTRLLGRYLRGLRSKTVQLGNLLPQFAYLCILLVSSAVRFSSAWMATIV